MEALDQISATLALTMGLAWASGINLYATLLTLGFLAHTGNIDLPPDLENKLGDLPKNVERVIVDDDVLLVQKGTDLILDVLEGVIKGQ